MFNSYVKTSVIHYTRIRVSTYVSYGCVYWCVSVHTYLNLWGYAAPYVQDMSTYFNLNLRGYAPYAQDISTLVRVHGCVDTYEQAYRAACVTYVRVYICTSCFARPVHLNEIKSCSHLVRFRWHQLTVKSKPCRNDRNFVELQQEGPYMACNATRHVIIRAEGAWCQPLVQTY
jgi:hypothetical protein